AEGQVVADDPDDLIVVEVRRPHFPLDELLLFLILLGLFFVGVLWVVVLVGCVLGLELGLIERDRMAGLAVDELLDSLVLLLELGISLAPLGGSLVEQGHQIWRDLVVIVVGQFGHFLELEGVVHLALAKVHVVADRRQVNVGGHSIDLGAVAVGPVKLLDRELESSVILAVAAAGMVADLDDALDRALAEGAGVADDQAPAVILDHAREDLRSAGAQLVDQDDQRTVPGRALIVVIKVLDPEDFLDLHDRAGVDEQAGKGLGLLKQAAAIVAQVDNDRVHPGG